MEFKNTLHLITEQHVETNFINLKIYKMKNRIKYLMVLMLLINGVVFSQSTGEIKGVVIDKETGETLVGASVWVNYGGNMIGSVTDFDGKFTIKPLQPGTYNVIASFIGKSKTTIELVEVKPDKIKFLDTISLNDNTLEPITIRPENDLIDPEEPSFATISESQIKTIANARDPKTLMTLASDGAITTSADEQEVYFRGSRDGSFITYFDGMKIEWSAPSVPMACLKSYSVYTGGLPAKYGDTSGGVVVIETKSFFDLYNQRVAEMGITYAKKKK